MRWLKLLLSIPALAAVAEAHGGSFGHGPPVIVHRGIPCDCGRIECDKCADEPLRRGDDVRISSPFVTQVKRWGDVARCRVEVTFEAYPDRGMLEAYTRVEPGPLFAAVAGSLRNGDETLSAELKRSEEARREYLYARRLFNFDPLLVLRRGPGRLDLRVYPLRKGERATAVLEGYLLVDAAPGLRLYRTDDRYLAVVPLATDPHRGAAAFRDEQGDRSLHFLSEAEFRERFGERAAEDVPFVPALESAITGKGNRAACDDTALVAIAAGSPQPPFVGPDRVERLPRGLPPGLREPVDPEPPPPPGELPLQPVASDAPPSPVAATPVQQPRFQR